MLPADMSRFEKLRTLLDRVCSDMASEFGLHDLNGKPRRATIIETIANSTCVGCIGKRLSEHTQSQRIDAVYKECHGLAVNILVEELYKMLTGMGYRVSIRNEARTEYGRADVLIKITNYGVNVHYGAKGLLVEVKTGLSLSLSQLFRYLLDDRSGTVVVWRVRRRQVLVFEGHELEPLLTLFMKTCIMRGTRVLQSPEPTTCEHRNQSYCWSPTQEEIQNMFRDFASALVETLPYVVNTILEKMGVKVCRKPLRQRDLCSRQFYVCQREHIHKPYWHHHSMSPLRVHQSGGR